MVERLRWTSLCSTQERFSNSKSDNLFRAKSTWNSCTPLPWPCLPSIATCSSLYPSSVSFLWFSNYPCSYRRWSISNSLNLTFNTFFRSAFFMSQKQTILNPSCDLPTLPRNLFDSTISSKSSLISIIAIFLRLQTINEPITFPLWSSKSRASHTVFTIKSIGCFSGYFSSSVIFSLKANYESFFLNEFFIFASGGP